MDDQLADMDFGDLGLGEFDLDLADFDLDLADFGDTECGAAIETRYVKPPLYVGVRRRPVRYDHAVKLARDTGPAILAGQRVFAVVSGNFIFGDFIEALAVEQNLLIDEMTISTLAISKDNVDSLHNLLVGDYVKRLGLIVSDYFYSHSRRNMPYIYEQLDIDDRFQFAVAGCHTKITLMRIGGRKIVMHGSANLRSSRCLENVVVETDPVLYDFNHEWHRAILDHYGTVRSSVRAGALYDLIGGEHE